MGPSTLDHAVSAVQGVAASQEDYTVVGWLGVFSPVTLIDGFSAWFLGATSAFPHASGPPNALAGIVYLLVILTVIAGSFGLLMRRYRKVGLSRTESADRIHQISFNDTMTGLPNRIAFNERLSFDAANGSR